jgi:hypothetical protein
LEDKRGKVLLAVLLTAVGLVGCAKEDRDDQLRQRARIEEEGQLEKTRERALKMESDLADRHYFYGAIEGEYEGSLTVGADNYKIAFAFNRTIPPYTGDRVRELSEIEYDINTLSIHMKALQWHPDDVDTAVPCKVSGVRPNMDEGQFVVASSECQNIYTVLLSVGGAKSFNDKKQKAIDLAEKIKNREVTEVSNLIGYVQLSTVPGKFPFAVRRVK